MVVLHAGAYMWRPGLACLSDSIVRMHALVHAVAAAVAKPLSDASDSNPVFMPAAPPSASASSPPPSAAAAAAAAAAAVAGAFLSPSSADVRSSAQQLQFLFRDMIAFVRYVRVCACACVCVCM